MERRGNDVVAIAISSSLDPIGEIGLGGYWVLRSLDGGVTWTSYYAGLRENMPYVVTRASTLPLLHGDRLRIEVETQELDTSSITFPPVALRVARSEKGLYLELPAPSCRSTSRGPRHVPRDQERERLGGGGGEQLDYVRETMGPIGPIGRM